MSRTISLRAQYKKKIENLKANLLIYRHELAQKEKSKPLQQFKYEKRKGKPLDSNLKRIEFLEDNIHSTKIEIDTWELIFQTEERKIKSLVIAARNLDKIPEGVFRLTNLTLLNISNNRLAYIPPELGNLTNLVSLDLSHNLLTSLPPEITKLRNLTMLQLATNRLTTFPLEITQISNIRYIDLSENSINNLPIEVKQSSKLEELHFKGNLVESLPIELQDIRELKVLDLRENRLSILPEVLEKINEPQKILDYYFTHLSAEKRPINEAKVLVIGQGSVGKTSIVERILYDRFTFKQTKTDGIIIKKWDMGESTNKIRLLFTNFKLSNSNDIGSTSQQVQLNIWDFGGQEIMHATHQFFLTKRSLYLLVLDARLTQEENRVEYWLKIIQSFGGESPVLIVGNKTDQHPLDIDRTGLQKKYPNIVGILETSAITGQGIEALKAEITKQVDTLPHVHDLLPETWFMVKSKLEELGKDKNFITQDEYLNLCGANNVTDETSQQTLIGFMHDLGVILYYEDDPRLEELGILNPEWVTKGVYKILNSHELFQNQGTLTLSMLNNILNLPEYPNTGKRLYIVDMMKKFELCYDIEPDKSFLIPDLLPKDEPFTGDWSGTLAFQYHYSVLPSSIITRFIVRMNTFIHKTIWRSGVVLKNSENTALVKADAEDRKIYIWVSGEVATRKEFLAVIRAQFDIIHKTIAKIDVTEKVPLSRVPEAEPVSLTFLQQLSNEGLSTFPVQAGARIVELTVKEVLNQIEKEGKSSPSQFVVNVQGNVYGSIGNDNTINFVQQKFEPIYEAIEASSREATEKQELSTAIEDIQNEVAKGEQADGSFLSNRMRNLKKMAPDIADVALATLANPAAGFAVIVQKIAKKIKDETK